MRQPTAPTTQKDLVKEQMKDHAEQRLTATTEQIRPPGIEGLHLKPVADIAEAVATIIKSRANVTTFTYRIGDCFEVTSTSNMTIE